MTTTKTINLRAIRTIADKYKLSWHVQGGGWVINGIQQHYSHVSTSAGEKAALLDYMANWGESFMSEEDFATVRAALAKL